MTRSRASGHVGVVAALVVALALGAAAPAAADTVAAIIDARAATGLPADLAVTAVHVPKSLAGLDVDPTTVDVDFPSAARAGRVSVKVRLRTARPRTLFIPVTLTAFADVALAAHALAPGAILGAADVRWERRAVDAKADAALAPLGQEVTAPIAAGELLDDARLTAPPPVARGTEVQVEVRKGVVAIAARGTLEQATRVGAIARVRLASGSYVSGTLADRGHVRVEAP